jgi:hypothetical protein
MNVTPAASKAIKFNSSNNGLETGDIGGSLVLISEQTASSSSAISFTSGIDSTYKEYQFHFTDIHPSADAVEFQFNLSTDGGSNYDVTKTTTFFRATHLENDTSAFAYRTGNDLAQSTAFQMLLDGVGNDDDSSACGTLHLFNPSDTTFVKHFLTRNVLHQYESGLRDCFMAGYGNTTSAVDAVQFKMSSGNIDSGTIKMYGVS